MYDMFLSVAGINSCHFGLHSMLIINYDKFFMRRSRVQFPVPGQESSFKKEEDRFVILIELTASSGALRHVED